MNKKNFIHVIDNFTLDDNLKYRIQRKVEDEMKKQEYQERNQKRTRKSKKVAIFSACLVAVMGVSMAMPVMADNTSILENLVSKIQQRNEVSPTKDYAVKVSDTTSAQVTDDSTSVQATDDNASSEHCITPYVDSYYCDGQNLYITYGIKANAEDLAKCNCICGGMDIKINGQSLKSNGKSTEIFTASSDELGLFIGRINVDISDIQNIEGSRVDIDFNVDIAFDSINYDFNYDTLEYVNRTRVEEKYLKDVVSFGFDVTELNPQIDVYEVNQTKDGNTLNSITVSPAGTKVDLNCQDGFTVRLFDSTGKELVWNSYIDGITYSTPMIDATSVTVGLYNDTQNEPVYSFEVPIKRGFNTGLDVADDQCYVKVEPVYNPPMEEVASLIDESRQSELDGIAKVGENSFECSNDNNRFKLTIDDFTIADDFDGMQFDNVMSPEYVDENGNLKDGYKALIVDATITSTMNAPQEFCRCFDLDSGIFTVFNEPIAFDTLENYNNSVYYITIQPNETKHMKIGFVVSEEATESPMVCNLFGYSDDKPFSVKLQ